MSKHDDAIAHYEYGISHDIFKEPVTTYARLAVDALRAQQERENPQPLTLYKLRGIPWRDPVWVSVFDGDGRLCSTWCHLRGQGEKLFDDGFIPSGNYGERWLAYDYQPLKEAK